MSSPIPTDPGIDNLAQIAIDGARALLNESKPNLKRYDRASRKRFTRLFKDANAIPVTVSLTDEVMRISSPKDAVRILRKASKNVLTEIIVVDNNSVDGSVQMVKTKFQEVQLLENKKNTGFSFANNQGLRVAKGEYVLLLNPDTVVEEDTFEKVISFMDKHPEAGGLGVKMLDGKGNFLPDNTT